ncbi:hypothetical protein O6H91_23G035800 [Diphasiastrum complanatum]|uniref:Uncharacterized protein n=1 Tax=Diphasiastrum complanatum TaxID=34168 RepID=A0ACC2A9Z8_DIPCM|nr:hypothetical protein O6H91_Y315900 [Diphasiastrum complanatum]KAJ7514266.1 hypothetical protein O6H91_23G035800 [Diphasiastrum complanatum]
MGKNEFLTPKAIANRIKAKGLQKLRWYCQMCQKQCRDENGFKCHCMSESHQRQMQVFGQNPDRFMDGYSEEFESSFMEHMKRSHRFSRVAATVVYNEYIADRHHIHMNSTKWLTLTEFVKYLGRTGQCKVDETPKGWFVSLIDKEPETLLKERLKSKRERADVADEERHERMIADQIEKAAKTAKVEQLVVESDKDVLQREHYGEKVAFALGSSIVKPNSDQSGVNGHGSHRLSRPPVFDEDEEDKLKKSRDPRDKSTGGEKDKGKTNKDSGSALAQLMKEQEASKERMNRKDYWLCEGLIVKVMSQALMEKGYYKQKGVVIRVIGKYVGEIRMLDGGDVLKVDQEELETVIPQIGGLVRIVNGAYRGSNARLLAIDTTQFSAKVQIEKGMYDGRLIPIIDYEDICKFNPKE